MLGNDSRDKFPQSISERIGVIEPLLASSEVIKQV